MATAINFNWVISEKVTDGKIYDFNFVDFNGNEAHFTCCKNGDGLTVRDADGPAEVTVQIFRNGMKVRDAIALALKRAGRVTSGEVYRAEILQDINADYEENEIYTDIFSPSHNFAANKPRKESAYYIGFELETTGRNRDCERALHNLRSNIWRQVTDASISGPGDGIEFVSTLLHPDDAIKPAFYADFFDMLTGLAVSGSLSSTGLHCHISREAFGDTDAEQDENIAKAIYLENFILSDSALTRLYGRNAGGQWARPNTGSTGLIEHVSALRQYSRNILNDGGIKAALQADLMQGNKTRREHNYPSERYHRINITNQHTVEFRQGKGQIKSQALANIAQHACTLAKYCRETAWHKLTADGYFRSIPSSAKYGELRAIFNPSTDNE